MSGILQTLFQNLRSFITGTGWLNSSTGTGTNFYFARIASDSANKTYSVGLIDGPGTTRQLTVSRFTTTGTTDLNVSLTGTSYPFNYSGYGGISVDSSGNIYAILVKDSTTSPELTKWNSSGTLQFQKYTTSSTATQLAPFQSISDASSNVYVAIYWYNLVCCVSSFSPAIIKYDSSGAVVWSYYYYSNSPGYYSTGIASDSSGNLWLVGPGNFVKTNSSGIATIIKTSGTNFYKVAIDSSNNIYMIGNEGTTGNITLYSVSSTGTITWGRKFVIGSSMNNQIITTDSSGNIYCVFYATNASSTTDTVILKYNSSGTLQWQRKLSTGTTSATPMICTDATVVNNNINIVGYKTLAGINTGFAISVPTNGALTGTIVVGGISYVYAVASGTDSAAATVTLTTQSNSSTSMSATNTTTSYSTLTNQLTNTVTTF